MNRLGMMVDVSHISDKAVLDAVEESKSPVVASHSSAKAVTPIVRNMPDDVIKAIAKKGGVININFHPGYLDEPAYNIFFKNRPARDKEINLILGDRDREKVQAIDEALSRVGDGSYGICESCESDIAGARLQALPFTRLCVNCQAERERELKMNRRFEEDRSFRRLSSSDGEDEGS